MDIMMIFIGSFLVGMLDTYTVLDMTYKSIMRKREVLLRSTGSHIPMHIPTSD